MTLYSSDSDRHVVEAGALLDIMPNRSPALAASFRSRDRVLGWKAIRVGLKTFESVSCTPTTNTVTNSTSETQSAQKRINALSKPSESSGLLSKLRISQQAQKVLALYEQSLVNAPPGSRPPSMANGVEPESQSLTNCRFYEEKYPEIESFVMVNVKQVRGPVHVLAAML